MKNPSKHKQNMGIYKRKQEGLYSIFKTRSIHAIYGLLTLKKVGRFLGLEYNMLHSIFPRLPCNAWKNRSS